MSKVNLIDVGSGVSSTLITNINTNSAAITSSMDNTLSRNGASPNQMLSNLDMNSYRLMNLPSPSAANDPARLQDLLAITNNPTVSFPASASSVTFNPSGGIVATDVQAAIVEAVTDAAASAAALYAPVGAPYVTIGNTSTLSAERALTVGQGLTLTDGGANSTATVKITDQNSQSFTFDTFPPTDDCAIRLAAGVDGHSCGISYIGSGNGLWVRDSFTGKYRMGRINGSFQTFDLHNCTINGVAGQSVPNGVTHYVYAYYANAGDNFLSVEFSPTAYTVGGESPIVKGWRFKNDGTFNKRLIGAVKSDGAGNFWRDNTANGVAYSGVFMSGVSSAFARQSLNYHTKVSGANSATTFTEINSNQYLSAFMWDDGNEPFIALAGSVSNTGTGNTTSVGICIDGATTPEDFVDVYCAVANKPYPFTVICRAGDFGTDLHTYRVFLKNDAGSGGITGNRNGSPATGATFSMRLEQ